MSVSRGSLIPNLSLPILLIVLLLIAARKLGRFSLPIWLIMLAGAMAALATGDITPQEAFFAINPDVMIFLFGMFTVGVALQESGYLSQISFRLFSRAKNADDLLLLILFSTGLLSAFLMNDTLAIVGTPLMLHLARAHEISPKPLLLALAYAVTTGSAMSPIGNPQNLLISMNGQVSSPFLTFFGALAIPTFVNLLAAYLLLRWKYGDQFRDRPLTHRPQEISDANLARLSRISLALILVMVSGKMLLVQAGLDLRLTYIAVIAALPLLRSPRRIEILRRVDWHTLTFFAAMFVLMESVWNAGILQGLIEGCDLDLGSIPMILLGSAIVSQIISNVPFVALFLPALQNMGTSTKGMMALAAGSTIAGNLFIMGAASNVIIIGNAEHEGETLTFMEFARLGIPLTAINLLVYWIFLH